VVDLHAHDNILTIFVIQLQQKIIGLLVSITYLKYA
jgi:hypothetical protein